VVQEEDRKGVNTKIRLSKPYMGDKADLMALIEEVLDSGFLVQGKYVARFEQEVAAYLGVKHAIAVSSGTAALHVSLIALGIDSGDEVIVPAYTFPATANVVELIGAKPVFVDVDLGTHNIQVERIEEAITPNTKAIIPVHLFGNPADMGPIVETADAHGLKVIEDAAGALGSEYRGRKCGTIGTLGCFSFHPRKIIATGEGGMVVTDDDSMAEAVSSLRNHGMRADGRLKRDFVAAGLNYRMNELEAVLGLNQMQDIERIIDDRQKLAELYMDLLGDIQEIHFQATSADSKTAWQAFVIRFSDRNNIPILEYLHKAGIEASVGAYALHLLTFYRAKYGFPPPEYSNAEELFLRGIALPFYNGITEQQVQEVCIELSRLAE